MELQLVGIQIRKIYREHMTLHLGKIFARFFQGFSCLAERPLRSPRAPTPASRLIAASRAAVIRALHTEVKKKMIRQLGNEVSEVRRDCVSRAVWRPLLGPDILYTIRMQISYSWAAF